MKSKLKTLIVTPNYNGKKFIEQTLQSVLNQTDKDFSYTIVDGESNDGSLEIINKYKDQFENFNLIIEKDSNMFEAVHKGIMSEEADIVIWINSDDILDKNAVKNSRFIFNKFSDINWFNGVCGYIKYGIKFSLIPYYFPQNILSAGKAHKKYWGYVQQESLVFKKNFYLKVGGLDYDQNKACDYFLWKKFSKLEKLNTFFVKIGYYRSHPDTISNREDNFYEKETGLLAPRYKKNLLRFFISLLMTPYFIVRTFF